jgi:hypothetical protein
MLCTADSVVVTFLLFPVRWGTVYALWPSDLKKCSLIEHFTLVSTRSLATTYGYSLAFVEPKISCPYCVPGSRSFLNTPRK